MQLLAAYPGWEESALNFQVPPAGEIQEMLDRLCLLAVQAYFLEEVLGKKIFCGR